MKKLVVVLVVSLMLVFAVGSVTLADMTVKAGYDLGGTMSSAGSSLNVDGGLALGFEYTSEMADNLMVGGGFEYQLNRKPAGSSSGFSFIPLYGLVQYKFDQFYVVGRLGYDLYNQEAAIPAGASISGGIYYGVGAGYSINQNMVVEAIYGISNASFSYMGITQTASYSKLGLSFGYKF